MTRPMREALAEWSQQIEQLPTPPARLDVSPDMYARLRHHAVPEPLAAYARGRGRHLLDIAVHISYAEAPGYWRLTDATGATLCSSEGTP